MPDPLRILSSPLHVAGGLAADELACVVAADALVRRAWAAGSNGAWLVASVAGDQGSQYALERDLARDGHDRATVPVDELVARAAALAVSRRSTTAELLARVGVTLDLDTCTTSDDVVVGGRTAFVRLYEEGLIEEDERVVANCPRCVTAVDHAAVAVAEVEGERIVIRLDNGLLVGVLEPELLVGVVAIAVPEDDPRAGTDVAVPLADRDVPVVGVAGITEPVALVPAHDAVAHEIAVRHGLAPVPVLAADGTVAVEGPLTGLARYAARAAARDLLTAEGIVEASEAAAERVERCASCGTVLVPLLGRHWFLRFGDLSVAAADAVRHGSVDVTPPELREVLLAGAVPFDRWCLSGSVLGGVPLPVARCAECGKDTVEVEMPSSCGKCMGALRPVAATLDARFLAALWPLVALGWPSTSAALRDAAPGTRAVVTEPGLVGWALPALALGLRLAATAPFTKITIHPGGSLVHDTETLLAGSDDARVLRLALVAGDGDAGAATSAVAALDEPDADDTGDSAIDAASAAAAALDDGAPAQAGVLLLSALTAGVSPDAADRVHALALPILGA